MQSWNGTVTNRKTIDSRLHSYYVRFVVIGILLGILVTVVVVFYSLESSRIMNSIYFVQEFFDTVKELDQQTRETLLLEREDTGEKIKDLSDAASQDLEYLEAMQIKGNYQRNIADLWLMYRDYLSEQEKSLYGEVNASEGIEQLQLLSSCIANKKEVLEEEIRRYYNRRRGVMSFDMLVLGILLVLTFLLAFLLIGENTENLAKQIVRPVKHLSEQAERIRGDEIETVYLNLPKEADVPVEIDTLGETFSHLLIRIGDQVTQLKETSRIREELKEQELENLRVLHELTSSELKCLQMQMNPHFLFNTLNMIQQTLYLDQKEKTSYLLKETASFLRYSLDYVGRNVPLERELEGLSYYVDLQEERLGDRIFFEFVLDERLNNWIVPCLILQPLVENSIIHGMAEKLSGAEITIRTQYDEKEGCGKISIEDNGQGMSAKKLERLKAGLSGESKVAQERIGLHNVARRLELFEYGRAKLEIDSKEGTGTVVTVLLREQKETEDGKGTDCG